MKVSPARRPSLEGVLVSEREGIFLQVLKEGVPPAAAAARAGFNNPTSTSRALLLRPHIRDAVAAIQAELSEDTILSRRSVFRMLGEAYDFAVKDENPIAIVRVAQEINKMCGYHAQTGSQQAVDSLEIAMQASPLEAASDEELKEIAELS